jgi:hypothetical protein
MYNSVPFNLTGFAHVCEISEKNREYMVKLRIIQAVKNVNATDDIWLDCKVLDKKLIALLHDLEPRIHESRILMRFKAEYSCFDVCYSQRREKVNFTKEENFVTVILKCVLTDVIDCFIKGESKLIDCMSPNNRKD